jgi:TM2 domain-containing membrane protein YozV
MNMNCINHPDITAVAYCRSCGKALCETCRRTADGTVYCEEHVPAIAGAGSGTTAGASSGTGAGAGYSPYTASAGTAVPVAGGSPGLAFLLGLIPGVGAIYNGQYVKGLIHAIVFCVLITIVSNGDMAGGMEPLFGIMIGVWVFYMAFEAYHTAKKRQMGLAVDEFSSLVRLRNQPGQGSQFPVGPAILIAVGVLFLLNNMEVIRFREVMRYWPIGLIALGAYMLYERMITSDSSHGAGPGPGVREATHERH